VATFNNADRRTAGTSPTIVVFTVAITRLDPAQMRRGEPLRDPGRGRGRRGGNRFEQLPRHVRPAPVQAHQKIPTRELAGRHRHHQLPASQPAPAFLHRPDTRRQRRRDPQHPVKLTDRFQPGRRRQLPIRATHPDPTRPTPPVPFCCRDLA